MRYTRLTEKERRLAMFEVLCFIAALGAHAVVLFLNIGYYAEGRLSDGEASGQDLALILGIGIALASALVAVDYTGYRLLPRLNGRSRRAVLIAYVLAVLVLVSFTLPVAMLSAGKPIAEAEHYQSQIEAADEAGTQAIAGYQETVAMIPGATAAMDLAAGKTVREKTNGAVSGTVGGTGRTVDALESIASVLGSGTDALVQTRSRGEPLVRRIAEVSAQLRRVAEDEELGTIEKARASRDQLIVLADSVAALRALAPIGTMSVVVDTLRTDWAASGLNEQASAKMRAAFVPIADRFDEPIKSMRDAAFQKPFTVSELRGFELLMAYLGAVWPALGLVLFLELLPMLGVFIVLATRNDDESEPIDPADWPTPYPRSPSPNGRVLDDEIPF